MKTFLIIYVILGLIITTPFYVAVYRRLRRKEILNRSDKVKFFIFTLGKFLVWPLHFLALLGRKDNR